MGLSLHCQKDNIGGLNMNEVNYVTECLPNGEFYAYLLDYHQCCAYGETEEEAIENYRQEPAVILLFHLHGWGRFGIEMRHKPYVPYK